ncbi:MAG: hypothetical protein IT442_18115 [Phycisphaeraceae bacterium]|nr:hypothetical protein [Phycisphaeraceae bacterium]
MDKKQLSGPQRRIIEQCQAINFGQITFQVRGGQPNPDKPWATRQTVKLAGGENGPRPEVASTDFTLRKEQAALIHHLSQLPDGTRVTVEVKHGLPFAVEIEQDHRAA